MSPQSASGSLDKRGHSVVSFECDAHDLWVKRVSLGTDDSLSMATLGVHAKKASGDNSYIRIEDVWNVAKKGQRVTIRVRQSQGTSRVIFHGWIQGANIGVGGRMEDLEYVCMGLDWGLKVEKVWGSWCKRGKGGNAVWLRGVPPVFNKDGKYNKSTSDASDPDGHSRVVFDLDDDLFNPASAWWNAAQMARYLVSCERKSELSSIEPDLFEKTYQPGGEISSLRPFDVNPEDEDVWGALVKLAHRCSHGVRIRYGDDRSKPELVFFTRKIDDTSSTKQIEIPEATLQTVSLRDPMTAASALDVQHDLSGIVRRVDVVCPPKLFDTEFTLLAGWKQEDEDDAFGGSGDAGTQIAKFLRETDPQTSSDWERFKWVGRRYILNETGRDDCKGSDQPFDFDDVFEGEDWGVHNRPFRGTRIERAGGDDEAAPLPIQIHVKFGTNLPEDIQLGANVRLLPDRAGIYFSGAPLLNIARALESGNQADILPSEVRIEAVIEGDQDAPHDASAEQGGGDQPVPTFGLTRLDEGYRQDNINESSADEIANDLAHEALDEMKSARLVGTAVIPWISFAFDPGDVLDKIKGRDLEVKALIAKVSWDAEQQSTELAFEYPTIDTATHSRHMRSPLQPGTHDGRQAQGLAYVGELLALQAMGHPVDEALRAAAGGASRSEVERILQNVIPGHTRLDDPAE